MTEPTTTKHKTRHRFENEGHARLLTCSCYHRLQLFSDDEAKQTFVEALIWTREKLDFDLWAWVAMPEHVHLLIHPTNDGLTVSVILSALKQRVANRVLARKRKTNHPAIPQLRDSVGKLHFWQQGGGHDRNLWTPKHIWSAIDYIHRNPVKREICERPIDWPWSSAREFNRIGSGLIPINHQSIPTKPNS